MASKATPLELIALYWGRVWNARECELVRDICADLIVRHDPMSLTTLSLDEQVARVRQQSVQSEPYFTHEVLLADDTHVCSVWNMHARKGEAVRVCGIEVFKAQDGRFTDCWNSSYARTYWGRDGGDGDPRKPPPPRKPWLQQDQAPAHARTPIEVVDLYWERGRNAADAAFLREICADPIAIHTPGALSYISVEEQIAAIADAHADTAPFYTQEVLLADDTHVCSVWNMHTRKGERVEMSGIDVFRVENGRIVQCWRSPPTKGAWARTGEEIAQAPLPPPHLLASVDEIDNGWMQSVFAHAGTEAPRIALVTIHPFGHGNLSTTVQASLSYNKSANNAPTQAICKFNSTLPAVQGIAARLAPYTTEVSAYHFFGETPPMLIPRAFFAAVSDDGLTANLVLEDLSAFCEPGDQITGCGQDEAAAVVEQLARLHAHYWRQPGLADLPWTADKRRSPSDAPDTYAAGAAIFRERYSADLSPSEMTTLEAFAPLVQGWMNRTPTVRTLIHSDPRVDNILFDRRGSEIRAYLLDWQLVSTGDPQYDVAYFLTGSLSPEDRRACERSLIARHAVMIARTDPAYNVDMALEAYRDNIVSGLYTTVSAATVMPDNDHNRRLLTTLARRNCQAVQDWDGLAALQR